MPTRDLESLFVMRFLSTQSSRNKRTQLVRMLSRYSRRGLETPRNYDCSVDRKAQSPCRRWLLWRTDSPAEVSPLPKLRPPHKFPQEFPNPELATLPVRYRAQYSSLKSIQIQQLFINTTNNPNTEWSTQAPFMPSSTPAKIPHWLSWFPRSTPIGSLLAGFASLHLHRLPALLPASYSKVAVTQHIHYNNNKKVFTY